MANEVMSEAREVCSFIGWNFFQRKCIINLGTDSVPGNVSMCLPQRWYVTLHNGS